MEKFTGWDLRKYYNSVNMRRANGLIYGNLPTSIAVGFPVNRMNKGAIRRLCDPCISQGLFYDHLLHIFFIFRTGDRKLVYARGDLFIEKNRLQQIAAVYLHGGGIYRLSLLIDKP